MPDRRRRVVLSAGGNQTRTKRVCRLGLTATGNIIELAFDREQRGFFNGGGCDALTGHI